MGIKTKLITIISLILVTGFLVTNLFSYSVSRTSIRSALINHELPLVSDNIYSEIQVDFLKPIFVSSLMANDTFVQDWILGGEENPGQIVRYLKRITDKYDVFTAFMVSEKTHKYYSPKGMLKTVSEKDYRDKWYFRVRDIKDMYEINVDPAEAYDDALTIFINYKILDHDGKFMAAIGVGLKIKTIAKIIADYQKSFRRNVFFVDSNGLVQLHSKASIMGKANIHDWDGIQNVAADIFANNQGFHEYKRAGENYLVTTRYIPELNWYLVVEQEESEAVKNIENTFLKNMAISLVVVVIVLLVNRYTVNLFQSKLETMATTDKLTGIYNRQAFEIQYLQVLNQSERNRVPFSLILFDIDLFKSINDKHGHIEGDEVLKHVVEITQSVIRKSDIFCRWGGEEFLILAYDCDSENAFSLAEKIRQKISSETFFSDRTLPPVTISSGVAVHHPDDDAHSLIMRADNALYQAKHGGRNMTVIDKSGPNQQAST